ncbi:twin-arginine translocation pathway signal protein [Roseomonas sp. OT10]|uniref:Bug family tripartite tricarboxylate transporter substrate binding protein n=1 Tax=Roseomonas cutis TaxID=2897332 RepID=UPI001E5AFDE7|nr:tripartite tricarboxylate transporter substrate-binding protein [Roseomonas sp. OT10]UFN50268.1 twin-arginine translocation pathway signal protein [Roseomonas sp. OT10]
MTTRRHALLAALAAPLAPSLRPGPALAQGGAWPQRPIRLIVPFAAGGAADSAARLIAPRLGEALGQTVVVENRTGGSGANGGAVVAQAQPDGYTVMLDASSHIVNPSLLRGLAFDYATAFAPISLVTTFPQVIAVKRDLPAQDLAAFIALAKQRPGALSVGTQGNATAGHMALARFQALAGVELTHVPYRGGADAARDLAAGTVDAACITMLSAGPVVDSGRARFLGVATAKRVEVRPDVPTFAELGLRGFEVSEWVGLFAPAGTPQAVQERLHAGVVAALANAEVRARLDQIVAVPVGSSPADFARFVTEGRESMAVLIREAGIRVD